MAAAFEFVMIGIMVGASGFVNMAIAFSYLKRLRQLNERTNRIFREIADKHCIEGKVLEPFLIRPVLRRNAIRGMMVGVPAALVMYDIIAVVIAMVRKNLSVSINCQTVLSTALEAIGGGSRVAGIVGLCVIAAGVVWFVLWNGVEKEIIKKVREARCNLRYAQERKWMSECGDYDI